MISLFFLQKYLYHIKQLILQLSRKYFNAGVKRQLINQSINQSINQKFWQKIKNNSFLKTNITLYIHVPLWYCNVRWNVSPTFRLFRLVHKKWKDLYKKNHCKFILWKEHYNTSYILLKKSFRFLRYDKHLNYCKRDTIYIYTRNKLVEGWHRETRCCPPKTAVSLSAAYPIV